MRTGIAVVALAFAALGVASTSAQGQALNEGCTYPAANAVQCPLRTGTSRYRVSSRTSQYLRLDNKSATSLELQKAVGMEPDPRVPFREFCVYLDDFATSQQRAGHGEVACRTKHDGAPLPPIVLGGADGLAVAPGESLFFNSSAADKEPWLDVEVTVKAGNDGVLSWRLPHQDKSIPCTGALQDTDVDHWQNETGKTLRLRDALIYAESGVPAAITKVSRACLSIIAADGHNRYASCSGLNSTGQIDLDQAIAPNERVVAFASNTCKPGGVWDWVVYLFVKP